jgi:hypothetical protein
VRGILLRWRMAFQGIPVDERYLTNPAKMERRIALKYCGGCNPGFDRVQYFNRIRTAAGDIIEWVTLDDRDFEAVLVISGCETACPEESIDVTPARIVKVSDNKRDPGEIAQHLLSEAKP